MKEVAKRLATPPLQLVLGPAIWLVWFGVIYGALSVACAVVPPPPERGPLNWVNGGLLLLTVVTAAGLAAAARASHRAGRRLGRGPEAARDRFLAHAATLLHATAAVSTIAVGLPLLLLPPCV